MDLRIKSYKQNHKSTGRRFLWMFMQSWGGKGNSKNGLKEVGKMDTLDFIKIKSQYMKTI